MYHVCIGDMYQMEDSRWTRFVRFVEFFFRFFFLQSLFFSQTLKYVKFSDSL